MRHTSPSYTLRCRFLGLGLFLLFIIPSLKAQQTEELRRKDFQATLSVISGVLSQVSNYFVDTINLSAMRGDALNYMLQQLDPYTVYMDREATRTFRESTTGQYGGIGAILRQHRDSVVVIESPMQGKAADKAGLRAGDQIWRVNGKSFAHAQVADVRNALRGAPGELLTIVVRRPGLPTDSLTVTFPREDVELSPVDYSELLEGGIGFVSLNSFTTTASDEVVRALDRLSQEAQGKLTGLILDLRGNGGGVLDQAIDICGLFLPEGSEVVSLRGRYAQHNSTYKTMRAPRYPTLPLVVLIDGSSASASEIVAGALQDYDRAVIVGQKSFGKGLVQGTRELPDSTLLKMTTARYYIPSGRSIQRLNYNHRGGAERIQPSDSLGPPYHTHAGRVVYAAGGITPDLVAVGDSIPSLLGSLLFDAQTFDFVTDYVLRHPTAPENICSFDLTDEEYDAFVSQVMASGFAFQSPVEPLLKNIRKVLESELRYEELKDRFAALESAIKPNTERLLETYKSFIRDYINMSIIARYHYDYGRQKYYLSHDKVLHQAMDLLRQSKAYRTLLTPTEQL